MVSPQVFSELLKVLHSIPLQPSNWELFLRIVCAETECRHAFFICSSSNQGLHMLGHGGSEDMMAAQRMYNETSGSIDPFRLPFLANPRIGVLEGDDMVPEAEFLETPLYKQVLQPAGLRYLTTMALSATPRRLEVISMWRGLDQGPMLPDKRELLELLMPHVQVALEVRQKLMGMERRAANVQTLLDRTNAAAFLLSSQGKVLHFNQSARIMLDRSRGVELRKGRLCATERKHDANLQHLLMPAMLGRPSPGGAMQLKRAGGRGRPLQIVATPIEGASVEVSGGALQRGGMMVLITDPETEIYFPDTVLKGLYGLTPAETEVANAYLTGYTSEEIALLRGVSVSTVRSQLKVLLHKTETKRQSDLLRLLMALPRSTPFSHQSEVEMAFASPI